MTSDSQLSHVGMWQLGCGTSVRVCELTDLSKWDAIQVISNSITLQ